MLADRRAQALGIVGRYGIGSLCDPFDPSAPTALIREMLSTLAATQHLLLIFQTRQPARANHFLASYRSATGAAFPLDRTMLMVGAENNATLSTRLPHLQESPARFHALRLEPLMARNRRHASCFPSPR